MPGQEARTRIATVLVVDDNRDSTEALGSLLEMAGYRVIAVTSTSLPCGRLASPATNSGASLALVGP